MGVVCCTEIMVGVLCCTEVTVGVLPIRIPEINPIVGNYLKKQEPCTEVHVYNA